MASLVLALHFTKYPAMADSPSRLIGIEQNHGLWLLTWLKPSGFDNMPVQGRNGWLRQFQRARRHMDPCAYSSEVDWIAARVVPCLRNLNSRQQDALVAAI